MAYISIDEIQKYVDSKRNWLEQDESPAKECLVINFNKGKDNIVIDEELVNETLYLQSRNGNVAVYFDKTGQIISIEIV